MRKELITGINAQKGAYLEYLLLKKGYKVHGIKRSSSSLNTDIIDPFHPSLLENLAFGQLIKTKMIRVT